MRFIYNFFFNFFILLLVYNAPWFYLSPRFQIMAVEVSLIVREASQSNQW